jgi:arylsulfatase A-like enzyme
MKPIFPLLLVLLAGVVTAHGAERPNIVWLVSEDYTASYSGPYGDPLARTPALDRLAADGIVMLNAHSTAPVCAPTRYSIITGRYAHADGAQHMRSDPPLPGGVRLFPALLREAGYYCTNNAKTDYNTSASLDGVWDANGRQAHWRNRRPGQPFFAVFNFEQSHESRLHQRETLITDPAKVRVPAWLPDTPTVRADLAQYYDCVSRADAAAANVLAELAADGLADDTIILSYSDNGGCLPRSKRYLYDNGTHIAMVLHVPEKFRHLAPAAPGSRMPEVINTIDLAPTMLSLAGLKPGAQFHGRAFAGPFRATPPAYTFLMRDRMDERYDLSRAVTDGRYRYIRNYTPAQPWGQHLEYLWRQASMQEWAALHRAGRLTPTQDAFFQPKPVEELFDCATDPDNVHNLARDPTYQPQLTAFRQALRGHQLAIRDTGLLPEPLMLALTQGKSPALLAADDSQYPLERLLNLVDALQQSGKPDPALLSAALRDPLAAVRYWAATCLQGPTAAAAARPLLSDAEPVVRLAAAEILLRDADDAPAWAAIGEELGHTSSPETKLLALNIAERLPRPYPSAWRAILTPLAQRAATTSGTESYITRAAQSLLNVP